MNGSQRWLQSSPTIAACTLLLEFNDLHGVVESEGEFAGCDAEDAEFGISVAAFHDEEIPYLVGCLVND